MTLGRTMNAHSSDRVPAHRVNTSMTVRTHTEKGIRCLRRLLCIASLLSMQGMSGNV